MCCVVKGNQRVRAHDKRAFYRKQVMLFSRLRVLVTASVGSLLLKSNILLITRHCHCDEMCYSYILL